MRVRYVLSAVLANLVMLPLGAIWAPSASAIDPLSATPSAIAPINAARNSTSLTLVTNRAGTYDLTWQLVDPWDSPVAGQSGSVTGQPLGSGGETAAVTFDGTNLTDNFTYRVTGTLTTYDPSAGTETYELAGTGHDAPSFYVDHTPPQTDIPLFLHPTQDKDISAIYPHIGTVDRPATTRIKVYQEDFLIGQLRNANGKIVRTFDTAGWWNGQVWDGTNSSGVLVPRGTYRLFLFDLAGNQDKYVEKIFVETRHRELRTLKRTFVARRTLVDTYVGHCSTLRRPSLRRRWAGSLGYYANTRCGTKTARASTVATLHGVRLPAADSYLRIQILAYGGAARARPHSTATLRYLSSSGRPQDARTLSSRVRFHPGARANSASFVVTKNGSFFWEVSTRSGARYDVRSYTVFIRYYVLV